MRYQMKYQTTIEEPVSYSGVGLHSGCEVNMRICPAFCDTGIVFKRTDLPGRPTIAAVAANVTSTVRATTLQSGDVTVCTVEHLLSALNALDIDNCIIEMDNAEPPVGDGSALVFYELLERAGYCVQDKARDYLTVDKMYKVEEDGKFIMALPYDGFRVTFTSINPHPLVGIQYGDFLITPPVFAREIAPARTIAYEKEVEQLRKMGLGLGGTLENVIVYDDDKWLTPLRYADELVRHKILDVVGDLRLVGRLKGHIVAAKSSHALNTRLAKLLAESLMKQGGNLQ